LKNIFLFEKVIGASSLYINIWVVCVTLSGGQTYPSVMFLEASSSHFSYMTRGGG
jgi:hypothetical protein